MPTEFSAVQVRAGLYLVVTSRWRGSSGVATGAAIGSQTVQRGAVTIAPSGLATGAALGTPTLNLRLFLTGLASGETYGAIKLNRTVPVTAIDSNEAFGSHTVARGSVVIGPTGISSSEAFGTAQITVAAQIISGAGAIATGAAYGTPVLSLRLLLTGMVSDLALGTLTTRIYVLPGGIATDEAFGSPEIRLILAIQPSGLTSGFALGSLTVARGPVGITATGIATGQACGSTALAMRVNSTGIASDEAFGTAKINRTLTATGIATSEAFGLAKLNRSIIATPANMKIARNNSAPKTPQNSTRCWYFPGTLK